MRGSDTGHKALCPVSTESRQVIAGTTIDMPRPERGAPRGKPVRNSSYRTITSTVLPVVDCQVRLCWCPGQFPVPLPNRAPNVPEPGAPRAEKKRRQRSAKRRKAKRAKMTTRKKNVASALTLAGALTLVGALTLAGAMH